MLLEKYHNSKIISIGLVKWNIKKLKMRNQMNNYKYH